MQTSLNRKYVMMIAGETSGDAHGAHLVRAMKQADPSLRFTGIGGNAMRAEGVDILVDASELSVVGITEVFSKIPTVLNGISIVKKNLRTLRPSLIILIDFPDFNLHIASIARKLGVPVLYYVSPQIWAWRSGRIRKIKQNVDHMAVILPFEEDYYTRYDIPATFVGHPLLDAYAPIQAKKTDDADEGNPVVGLLPGSRVSEISRNLPYMLASASILNRQYEDLSFLLSVAPSISSQWMESFVNPYKKTCRIELVTGKITEVFEKSTLILAASGTVTLETAIYGVPMVIMYRISPLSYMLGSALVRVNHIGLVNIIADERVVPELIQKEASPVKIARTVSTIINDSSERHRIKEKLAYVKSLLGKPGASEKTAEIALALLKSKSSSSLEVSEERTQ